MNIIYSPIFPRICRKPRVKQFSNLLCHVEIKHAILSLWIFAVYQGQPISIHHLCDSSSEILNSGPAMHKLWGIVNSTNVK